MNKIITFFIYLKYKYYIYLEQMKQNVKYPNRLPKENDLPKFYRQTHKKCEYQDCTYCVSSYSHKYCIYCCDLDSKEYKYHFITHILEEDLDNSDFE